MIFLFTILAIQKKNGDFSYLNATKKLIENILEFTTHDILISTNCPSFFQESARVSVRNPITENHKLIYDNGHFNYNLKYLCFDKIPLIYDYIVYIDGDIKMIDWKEEEICSCISEFDFIGTRLGCRMFSELEQIETKGKSLLQHKIKSYETIIDYKKEKINEAVFPSEHCFIIKNIDQKVQTFHDTWETLNNHMQSINARYGVWGDAFEIGISAAVSGYEKYQNFNDGLYFKFNGNKE